jgi:hypothetical protein
MLEKHEGDTDALFLVVKKSVAIKKGSISSKLSLKSTKPPGTNVCSGALSSESTNNISNSSVPNLNNDSSLRGTLLHIKDLCSVLVRKKSCRGSN